jgi:hypothetical protein
MYYINKIVRLESEGGILKSIHRMQQEAGDESIEYYGYSK